MENNPLIVIDLVSFVFGIALFVACIYSAWVNLILKRISRFGFDAFVLLMLGKKNSNLVRSTPRSIQRMGIACLLLALGTIQPVYDEFIKYILPHYR